MGASSSSMRNSVFVKTLLCAPEILRSYKRILLVSHMRANTSLLGHLLGSNPQIEGYYELHMGYYSWKSFLRQKILYFSEHRRKPGAAFLFDKVLHDDHAINMNLFKDEKVMFSLRRPASTIKSIISLYRKVDPGHEYSTVDGATNYYLTRLAAMRQLANQAAGDFLYLDSDSLRLDTRATLKTIGEYLGLESTLDEHYDVQPLTGQVRVGDSSDSIGLGWVEKKQHDYSDIYLPEEMHQAALSRYWETRQFFLRHKRCAFHVLTGEREEAKSAC